MPSLSPDNVFEAQRRISSHTHRTPLLQSRLLNDWLGHELLFKAENLQRVGAFKLRGAVNALAALKEKNALPKKIVAYSSGNHAQAVAYASGLFGTQATIYMTKRASSLKKAATRHYGAEIIETDTRKEAEALAEEEAKNGSYALPPFDDDAVIAGQGTACLEALQDDARPDAVFAPCGGGGLLSGTYLAASALAPDALVFAAEPKIANDAALSYRSGTICRPFSDSPPTLADGAATLCVSERTFAFLKKLSGFYEIEETEIVYWTQWLTHLLKTAVEPTSALAMAAACAWLREQTEKRRILLLLSGGNLSAESQRCVWEKDFLCERPSKLFRIIPPLCSHT
ncbi:MAG: serine/threonine dehydratase [Rickettsiales bacterium]